jgi:hypothetical protein
VLPGGGGPCDAHRPSVTAIHPLSDWAGRSGASHGCARTLLDDGTTWWRGAPPRKGFHRWAPGPEALPLDLVRAVVAAAEATDDRVRLAHWAQLLAHAHATDPVRA